MSQYGILKYQKIKNKADISYLFQNGKRYNVGYFSLIFLGNDLSYDRFAVVVSKKFGNAVYRNKIKRLCRELFRHTDTEGKPSLDILIYPHKRFFKFNQLWELYKKWRLNIKV